MIDSDRERWLAERKKGIGGSDVGAVFNLDYGCARALYYDKTDEIPDFPKKESPEMERGTLLEPVILKLYKMRSGRQAVEPNPKLIWSKDRPYMGVSMDAITEDAFKIGTGYAEFKCVNRFVMQKFKKDGIRGSYILQMQHGLMVAELQWGSFGILCLDPWEFLYFDVDANPDMQMDIAIQERNFWTAVESKAVPEPLVNEKDKRCASCPWRKTCRGSDFTLAPTSENEGEVIHSPELLPLVAEWVDLDQLVKAAEDQIEPIKEQLRTAIGDNYGVSVPGARVLMPRWEEERWETKQLNSLLPLLTAAAETNEWIFEKSFDELLSDAISYIRLIALVVKSRKTSKKSSLRYYASSNE